MQKIYFRPLSGFQTWSSDILTKLMLSKEALKLIPQRRLSNFFHTLFPAFELDSPNILTKIMSPKEASFCKSLFLIVKTSCSINWLMNFWRIIFSKYFAIFVTIVSSLHCVLKWGFTWTLLGIKMPHWNKCLSSLL